MNQTPPTPAPQPSQEAATTTQQQPTHSIQTQTPHTPPITTRMRGYSGALFMGSAKILGEEGVKGNADKDKKADSQEGEIKREESDED
ncbi:unnamed protein product [Penicillium discolor]